jgi:hypothetical protein
MGRLAIEFEKPAEHRRAVPTAFDADRREAAGDAVSHEIRELGGLDSMVTHEPVRLALHQDRNVAGHQTKRSNFSGIKPARARKDDVEHRGVKLIEPDTPWRAQLGPGDQAS